MKRTPLLILALLLLGGIAFIGLLKSLKHEDDKGSATAEKNKPQANGSAPLGPPLSAAIAASPTRVQPVDQTVREFWVFTGKAEGDAANIEGKLAAESRGKGVTPSGRRYRIDAFPDLRSLIEGSEVTLAMPDGRVFPSVVNYSRRDEGYENTHQVAIGFKGNKGGLVANDDAVSHRVQGRLLIEGDKLAWTLELDGKGTLWLVEHLREDLVCELPASAALAPNNQPDTSASGPVAAAERSSPLPGDSTVTGSGTIPPTLNSRPGATAVLYIDFNGEPTMKYPDWPSNNPGGVPIVVPHSGLTADQMTAVWRRVAEDYVPFNINVSTEIAKYNAVSPGQRMRILVGNGISYGDVKAGLAWLQSFRTNAVTGKSFNSKVPCWLDVNAYCFGGDTPATLTVAKLSSLASNVSHEFGHTLALTHDGPGPPPNTDYYPGHGTSPFDWSPIMGSPYRSDGDVTARGIIQWAKNDYPGANNPQNDINILTGTINGFGYASDESSSFIDARVLTSTAANQVGSEGVIAGDSDYDWWQFHVKFAGSTRIEVVPADESVSLPNLDCGFRIEDATGTQVAGSFRPVDDLEANATVNLAPGTYYVVAYGTGNRQFSDSTGYSDWASMGRYLVTVDLPPDITDPVPIIQSPVAGTLGNPNLQFYGTATDDDSVSSLGIYLRRNADNAYWNGSYWQVEVTTLSRSFNAGAWNCTSPLPTVGGSGPGSLNAGTYDFIAIAQDPAGRSKQATVTVTVDSSGPTVTITSPTVTLGTTGYSFNGTSQDSNGVQAVNCFIRRDSDGKFWDGSGWGTPAINLPTDNVSRTTSDQQVWQCMTPNLPQPGVQLTQGTYTFIAIATDPLGNNTQRDSVVLIDDNQPPQVTVTTPSHNSAVSTLTSIGGTATDLSGIKDNLVTFTLYQVSGAKYWDGAAWASTQTELHGNVSGNNWSSDSVPLPSGNNLTTGYYLISASARDNNGTPSDAVISVNQTTFLVDHNPPTVTIDSPLTGTTVASLPSVSGTAGDSGGISTVRLYLYRYSDGKFWDGSSWGGGGPAILPTQVTGDSWSSLGGVLPVPGSNQSTNLIGGTYDIIAFAVDNAGNQTRTDSVITVEIIYTWTGATFRDGNPNNDSHSWGTPENWSPIGVPGPNDIAVIDNGDTVDSSISRTVAGLRLISGNMNFTNGPTANGTLITTGHSIWSSGDFNGIWGNDPDGTLDLTGTSIKNMVGGAVLNNSGIVNWTGGSNGYVRGFSGGCTINNLAGGTYNVSTDYSPFEEYNGGNVFNNAGTFVRAAGSGTISIHSWTFNSTGTIRCETGTLQFDGPLNLNNATSTFAGASAITFNGNVHVNASFTITPQTPVSLVGGGLTCAAGTNVVGTFEWVAGTVYGTMAIPAGSTLNLTGASIKDLRDGAVLNNSGTVNWTGGANGFLRGYSGACTVNNLAGGTYNVSTDAPPFEELNGGNVFNNAGTFVRLAGVGPMSIHTWTFNNTGTIQCDGPVLRFDSTLNLDAGSVLTGAGQTQFNGSVNLHATILIQSNVSLVGGSLNCTATALVNGTLEWSAGTVYGVLTIPSGSTLNLTGASIKDLRDGAVLNNSGTVNWTGGANGYLRGFSGGCTVNNLLGATYHVTTDYPPFEDLNVGNVFNNSGTFVRSSGAGTMSVHAWTFNNTGSVRCETGVLQFETTLNLNVGSLFAGASAITFNGAVNANASFTTQTAVSLIGGSFASLPGTNLIGTMEWVAGTLYGVFTIPSGSVLNMTGAFIKEMRDGAVLNNAGTVNWSGGAGGPLRGFNGACIVNNLAGGIYCVATNDPPLEEYNGGNVFNNAGTVVRASGSGVMSVHAWAFNNTGTVRCETGILQFETTLNINEGSLFGGASEIRFNGDARINASFTTQTTVTLIGGSLWSAAGPSVLGSLEWVGGSLFGTLTIADGSVLNLTGAFIKEMRDGAVLNNAGTVNWTGGPGGYVRGFNGQCVINNLATGTYNIAADGAPLEEYNGGNVFNNSGVFIKTAGAGNANVHNWNFRNSYKIVSNSGNLIFDGGELDLNAGSLMMGLSEIHLSGGTTMLRGETLSLGGHVITDGTNFRGHADGTGNISGGGWDWNSGWWSGVITIGATGVVSLVGNAERNIDFGARIDNYGTFTAVGTGSLISRGGGRFNNHAGATMSVAALPFTIQNGDNLLTNDGTIVVGSPLGNWSINWDFTQSSTGRMDLELGGLTVGSQYDRAAIGGMATLGGKLNVSLRPGYTPSVGDSFAVLTFGARTGSFATVPTPGMFTSKTYHGNDLSIAIAPQPANLAEWKDAYFGGSNSPNAADDADPDNDGVSNLLEYATDADPLKGIAENTPADPPSGGFIDFHYTRAIIAMAELQFRVEWNDVLDATDWSNVGVTESILSDNGVVQQVKARVPTGGNDHLFIHLKVTKP